MPACRSFINCKSSDKNFRYKWVFRWIAINFIIFPHSILILTFLNVNFWCNNEQNPPLLLDGTVSLLLYILSMLLVISSSLILYLYGHGRLSSRMRDRRMISTKSGDNWAYFAHCASLCFILALAVVKAPLMHDFSAIYKGSLDGAVLLAGNLITPCILSWRNSI